MIIKKLAKRKRSDIENCDIKDEEIEIFVKRNSEKSSQLFKKINIIHEEIINIKNTI